ncbi:ferritin [Candidatus Woesearchaeota archaeon]|nr:ferritin [Candidatus Woesearchaeota archaeon]
MGVKTWVCKICGDPYIGEEKPTECPFCGANHKYIVPGTEYKEPVVGEVSQKSASNVMAAIKLEVDNAQFYFCASRKASTVELQKRFKALGKVESEHATLLSKIVKAQNPAISRDIDMCKADDRALMQEALEREDRAIKKYTEFLGQATEMRVKQVFAALVEIENTHLELEENSLNN